MYGIIIEDIICITVIIELYVYYGDFSIEGSEVFGVRDRYFF